MATREVKSYCRLCPGSFGMERIVIDARFTETARHAVESYTPEYVAVRVGEPINAMPRMSAIPVRVEKANV